MSALLESLTPYLETGQPTVVRRAGAAGAEGAGNNPESAVDWRLLQETLDTLPQELKDPAALQVASLELFLRLMPTEYVGWVSVAKDGKQQCDHDRVVGSLKPEQYREAALWIAGQAVARKSPTFASWENQANLAASYVDGTNTTLVAIVSTSLNPSMASAICQLIALRLSQTTQRETPALCNTSATAAALELVVRLAGSPDMKSAAKLICDLVRQKLAVAHVAVGLVKRPRMNVDLAALSDVVEVDRHSEATRLITDCLTESLPQPTWVTWSKSTGLRPVGLGNWQRLADLWQANELAAVRLTDRSGDAVAVCLIASSEPVDEHAEQFLMLTSQIAGPLLSVVERGAHGRWLHTLRQRASVWLTGWRACAIAALVLTPLVYPWSARTTCPVVLEPVAQRLIAAPFEGVFDHSLVLPGEHVQAGQVLGTMDGRELRTRIAACEADITRASKSRDVNMAAGKLAAAQIDRLEMERLEHERMVFTHRLEQVDIRSPIEGIVVTGDLRRYESATVKVGQSLYEIAPLNRLVAEMAVPEEDLEQVADGAELSLWLDAAPGNKWEGSVERLHPRGELRDNRQVFIAETTLTNDEGTLRPGMKGSATVLGPRSPGIWLLIRKPWHEVRRFLGW